jgi:hypothetical protein
MGMGFRDKFEEQELEYMLVIDLGLHIIYHIWTESLKGTVESMEGAL